MKTLRTLLGVVGRAGILGGILGSMVGCGYSRMPYTPLPPQPVPVPVSIQDFTLSVAPGSAAVVAGASVQVAVVVVGVNGFTAAVGITTSGAAAGVTLAPTTFSLAPGTQSVTVATLPSTAAGPVTITFTGTAGILTHTAQLTLNVTAPVVPPPSLRTRYLRNDSVGYIPPHSTVYDAAHRQIFVSNPSLNEIDVYDAAREVRTGKISVPSAWGLDLSPTTGALYAGTLIGDIYRIDTSTLTVAQRYPSASIGPNGYVATTALVLADGRLALQGSAAGIIGVDGYGGIAVWDPATNALDNGVQRSGPVVGQGICTAQIQNQGAFAVSGDRMRILTASIDEGGGGEPVCSYDPVARIETYGTFPFATFVRNIVPTPDGKRFFLTSALNGVGVFDTRTAQMVGRIAGADGNYSQLPSGATSAAISLDGGTLYLVEETDYRMAAFDTTTYAQKGWVPSFVVNDPYDGAGPSIAAIDETGLLAGPIAHGVAFVDASHLFASPPTILNPAFASPPTGPVAGGTAITGFLGGSPTDGATLTQVDVGANPGQNSFFNPGGGTSQIGTTTPPATLPGAVDLTATLSDGGIGIAPENFSYGPSILEVVPTGATAEGGQIGTIIGYGFGNTTAGVQVTVGGQAATVTLAHIGAPLAIYPFPVNELQFRVPPGAAGTAVDVTVTTASGSVTAAGAFRYAPAVQTYPLMATLVAGIHDAGRDLYYFSDTAKIQVLSRASGWLTPIALPGVDAQTQLWAISESPDGTKLAVSDLGGQAIYVLDPNAPGGAQRFPMPIDYQNQSLLAPAGLAVTNAGVVYFLAEDIGGTGTPAFYKLVISSGAITPLGTLHDGGAADRFSRVLLSPDGTRVYGELEGATFWLDTANDQIHYSQSTGNNAGGTPDLSISADGSTVHIDGFLADASLQAEVMPYYIDWEVWFPLGEYGAKLNGDGSLLFQPLKDGIDILARNTGRLLYRIQLPVAVAAVYDGMVLADARGVLGVITANGVSFVDLTGLPVPSNVAQPFAKSAGGAASAKPASAPLRRTAPPASSLPGQNHRLRYQQSAAREAGVPWP